MSACPRTPARRRPAALSASGRLAAWLVTGPLGHLAGGVIEWAALLARWTLARARGRDPWA